MRINLVKQALKEGKVQYGTGFWQMRSPEIPRLLKAAGFHWAFVDTEHGGFDLETVQDICRVANLVDFCPIVRMRSRAVATTSGASSASNRRNQSLEVVHGRGHGPERSQYAKVGRDPTALRTRTHIRGTAPHPSDGRVANQLHSRATSEDQQACAPRAVTRLTCVDRRASSTEVFTRTHRRVVAGESETEDTSPALRPSP